ncbi:beta family protein [Aneurinibacillus terranovensis]|uniref:beta family protein n=1 Tax=Aneurinibacillus terranovensis TaxID=278991 RepID=UPI0004198FBD|nr:beta family protein [Aneurinibacillus terranovensis]
MFEHNQYVPIVRWRRGEQKALQLLDPALKNSMTPLIEIPPIPWNFKDDMPEKTIDEFLEGIATKIRASWDHEGPVLIDALQVCLEDDEIMQDGRHPLEFIIDEIQATGITAIPVTGSQRGVNYQQAVKNILARYNDGLCIRLENNDFDALAENINWFLQFFNITPEETDVIMDYKYVDPRYETRITRLVVGTISTLPHLLDWRTLTFTATAVPEDLSQISTGQDGAIPRTEWLIYKKVIQFNVKRSPSFGDYIISNPSYGDFNPLTMQMAAGIRYTVANDFLIFRGYSVRSPRHNGWGQAQGLCERIITHPQYCGQHYSYGDDYIYECAKGNQSTGTAETWRRVGTNHHLTLAINELSNLHAASTTC